MSYFDNRITRNKELERHPPDDTGRAKALFDLADSLDDRYLEIDETADLEGGIASHRSALDICPAAHAGSYQSRLKLCLCCRYMKDQAALSDLEEAITLTRAALGLCPLGHSSRAPTLALNDLADDLKERFLELGVDADINEAIALHRAVLDLRPAVHSRPATSLHQLANCLWPRYSKQGTSHDLQEAIALGREALELRPSGHLDHAVTVSSLADYLMDRFLELNANADLNEAIALHRSALDLRPAGHSDRTSSLRNLSLCLWYRYRKQATIPDLEEAITLGREALEFHPPGHSGHAATLSSPVHYPTDRFLKLDANTDLDEAIALRRWVLKFRPVRHSRRSNSLLQLALSLCHRYSKQGTINDLEEAITLAREALKLRPSGHSGRAAALNSLADYLTNRFLKIGINADLDEAIALHRSTLNFRPANHSDRPSSLHKLALCLWYRYRKRGTIPDLEEAITLSRDALELHPPGHSSRAAILSSIAHYLRDRFLKLGAKTDLDEAITLCRSALDLRLAGHPDRSKSLCALVYCLSSRFEKQQAAADLDELIGLHLSILDFQPPGHPDHTATIDNLLLYVRKRFQNLDMPADLNECISLERAALVLSDPGNPDRVKYLLDLYSDLYKRFQNIGACADLEEAITLGRSILDIHPLGDPNRPIYLNTYVICLRKKFVKTGIVGDEAVLLAREAVVLHPVGDPDHQSFLHTLATFLSAKFQKEGDLADLEQAIVLRRDLLALCPSASSLHELALCLSEQFDRRGVTADIDEAIELILSALKLRPPGHPDRAMSLKTLVLYRQKKFKKPIADTDMEGMKKLIMRAVYDALELLPPRLLNTQTGTLCGRDALTSIFENSQEYKKLLSSSASYPPQCNAHIRDTISTYFRYVTLSHRWEIDEPMLRHIQGRGIYDIEPTDGLMKLQWFCVTAYERGYLWAWSDTCCIDKDSTAELAKSIASMFSWYRRSALTIVYLSDVSEDGMMCSSAWFKRGWTLQELLAPRNLLFYKQDWSLYKESPSSNHKEDDVVLGDLEDATGITRSYFADFDPGLDNARSKLQWASERRTTEPEDVAYSLFGIFNVFLPIIPGESAENALGRLLAEIISQSGDISVLDWVGEASLFNSCFPSRISSYQPAPSPPSTWDESELRPSKFDTYGRVVAGIKLFDTLSTSDIPQFVGRLLRLPCIVYQVIELRLRVADPLMPSFDYELHAHGLTPFEITLSNELKLDAPRATLPYVLVRPWHPKLIASFSDVEIMAVDKLVITLGQPFSALLLEQQSRKEYKRIASSAAIVARPVDAASVLQSKLQVLNVV
ncbi:hypothetical protein SCLCIDRAFT_26314 [Scleroderma citrinum Foug A]|uniref:Heterokaryon incompatibility domain-containing protein n=1 Tax=Scleroderma citrinum Foug A TaxID=1036808 RepID=A0A0C3A7F5_9AGAM|nr:hypothetical protein SCLCIDRAFT_26314 [Scleroderma citrinum Foug A]